MFCRNESGSIAIPAAVAGVLIVVAAGGALDVSRMVSAKSSLQAMADAAALAAAAPEDIRDAERETIAVETVKDYLRQTGSSARVADPDVSVIDSGRQVVVGLSETVDLHFGGLIGHSDYAIGASATAEEYVHTGGENATISISFVVDLSDSMRDKAGRETKLDMVRSSITQALGGMGTQAEAGLYPFNWGTVDAKVVPLQPGSGGVIAALGNLPTGEGSVPSDAMEEAARDQRNADTAQRYIVYLTDGSVDVEKSDTKGVDLADGDVMPNNAGKRCDMAEADLIEAQDELAQDVLKAVEDNNLILQSWPGPGVFDDDAVKYDSNDSPGDTYMKQELLLAMSAEILTRDGGVRTEDLVEDQLNPGDMQRNFGIVPDGDELREDLGKVIAQRNGLTNARRKYEKKCRPVQKERVVDACMSARSDAVDIIAVDMSGETNAAADITQLCAFGDRNANNKPNAEPESFPYADLVELGGTGPGDPLRYRDANGSIYVKVSDGADLRSVLMSILPSNMQTAQGERRVALVE